MAIEGIYFISEFQGVFNIDWALGKHFSAPHPISQFNLKFLCEAILRKYFRQWGITLGSVFASALASPFKQWGQEQWGPLPLLPTHADPDLAGKWEEGTIDHRQLFLWLALAFPADGDISDIGGLISLHGHFWHCIFVYLQLWGMMERKVAVLLLAFTDQTRPRKGAWALSAFLISWVAG